MCSTASLLAALRTLVENEGCSPDRPVHNAASDGGSGEAVTMVDFSRSFCLREEIEKLEKEKTRVERELETKRELLRVNQQAAEVDFAPVLRAAIHKISDLEAQLAAASAEKEKAVKEVAELRRRSHSGSETNAPRSVPTPQCHPTTTTMDKLGIDVGPGDRSSVTVVRLSDTGAARKCGVRVNDTVVQLNRQYVRSVADYRKVLRSVRPDAVVKLQLRRRTPPPGTTHDTCDPKACRDTVLFLDVDPEVEAVVPLLPLQTLPLTLAIKEREQTMKRLKEAAVGRAGKHYPGGYSYHSRLM